MELFERIVQLRQEKARMLGYESFAHYQLERNVVKVINCANIERVIFSICSSLRSLSSKLARISWKS